MLIPVAFTFNFYNFCFFFVDRIRLYNLCYHNVFIMFFKMLKFCFSVNNIFICVFCYCSFLEKLMVYFLILHLRYSHSKPFITCRKCLYTSVNRVKETPARKPKRKDRYSSLGLLSLAKLLNIRRAADFS